MRIKSRGSNMTWEWSHSQDAIDNLRENIRNLDADILINCYCEIKTYKFCVEIDKLKKRYLGEEIKEWDYSFNPGSYYNEDFYEEIKNAEYIQDIKEYFYEEIKNAEYIQDIKEYHIKSTEEYTDLSEYIFNFACELRQCTNGGYYAYISPYQTYEVSFSKQEEDKENGY